MKRLLPLLIGLLAVSARAADFTVSPQGDDRWSGTLSTPNAGRTDGPFRSLERARDAVRALKDSENRYGDITVAIRGGTYRLSHPFVLTRENGGVPEKPIRYVAFPGERPIVSGAVEVRGWVKLRDRAILDRLKPAVRGKVWVAKLDHSALGGMTRRPFKGSESPVANELFRDGVRQTIARWPDEGWLRNAGTADGQRSFVAPPGSDLRWKEPQKARVGSYFKYEWGYTEELVESVDPKTRTIALQPPYSNFGIAPRARFFVENVLEELDAPGEFYVDEAASKVYFVAGGDPRRASTTLTVVDGPLLRVEDAANVEFRGIAFEQGRDVGVLIQHGTNVSLDGCVVRGFGRDGVAVLGGANDRVVGCRIADVGETGLILSGGDRQTLTPSAHRATDNDISDTGRWVRTYTPAVRLEGVGQIVAHNRLHDLPHTGVLMTGNDHLVEANLIERVCLETGDSGAIYIGREITDRGTVIRGNLIRDCWPTLTDGVSQGDVLGVYLDDCNAGITVEDNLFVHVGQAMCNGGGRDNVFRRNIVFYSRQGIWIDARGRTWAKDYFDRATKWGFWDRLAAVPRDLYNRRYPGFTTIDAGDPADLSGVRVEDNVIFALDPIKLSGEVTPAMFIQKGNRFVRRDDFVDPAALDFRLKSGGGPTFDVTSVGPRREVAR